MIRSLIPFILLAAISIESSLASELALDPFIHTEAAAYQDDEIAATQDQVLSFIPGYILDLRFDSFSLYSKIAYRFDSFDAKRDIWYYGENYLEWQDTKGLISLSAGLQRLQLGSLDIFQSVDLINDNIADSYVSDIARQGYPMMSFKYFGETSKFSLYYLPYFITPYYPANSARMGLGLQFDQQLLIDSNGERYESKSAYQQYGFKFDDSTESVDFTLGYFHIADRSLSFIQIDPAILLTRFFFETDLFFMNMQWTIAETIIKANLFHKQYPTLNYSINDASLGTIETSGPKDHTMAGVGIENKWQIIKGHDTTLLIEYQRILGVSQSAANRYNVFANDIAWGVRHQFNDSSSKQLQLVNIIDLSHAEEQIFQIDYRQNITDPLKFSIGLRLIEAQTRDDQTLGFDSLNGLTIVDDADTIYSTLSYIF